ncbi:hypothetical protein SISNIDRAFT_469116 [Sistotremastrum niveocremeum HHB9708]|uniref:Uncharacterized protein n=1 Tax=Sistotremastrum niveocremeum HHB9708 TaxID=1314777 RepID=A0A164QEX4_9AGAM|nr:hypothetical protein SISNIDRAFT_469116 [Sistotremastrum niveocremeum HHB9708]
MYSEGKYSPTVTDATSYRSYAGITGLQGTTSEGCENILPLKRAKWSECERTSPKKANRKARARSSFDRTLSTLTSRRKFPTIHQDDRLAQLHTLPLTLGHRSRFQLNERQLARMNTGMPSLVTQGQREGEVSRAATLTPQRIDPPRTAFSSYFIWRAYLYKVFGLSETLLEFGALYLELEPRKCPTRRHNDRTSSPRQPRPLSRRASEQRRRISSTNVFHQLYHAPQSLYCSQRIAIVSSSNRLPFNKPLYVHTVTVRTALVMLPDMHYISRNGSIPGLSGVRRTIYSANLVSSSARKGSPSLILQNGVLEMLRSPPLTPLRPHARQRRIRRPNLFDYHAEIISPWLVTSYGDPMASADDFCANETIRKTDHLLKSHLDEIHGESQNGLFISGLPQGPLSHQEREKRARSQAFKATHSAVKSIYRTAISPIEKTQATESPLRAFKRHL